MIPESRNHSGPGVLPQTQGGFMLSVTITTKAGGFEYPVTFQAFESLTEAREIWAAKGENPDDVELGILNASQEQNAKQGGKSAVLKPLKAGHDADSPEVADGVALAQKYAASYIIGSPRGGTLRSGLTKTQSRDMGVEISEVATPEQVEEIRRMLGI